MPREFHLGIYEKCVHERRRAATLPGRGRLQGGQEASHVAALDDFIFPSVPELGPVYASPKMRGATASLLTCIFRRASICLNMSSMAACCACDCTPWLLTASCISRNSALSFSLNSKLRHAVPTSTSQIVLPSLVPHLRLSIARFWMRFGSQQALS